MSDPFGQYEPPPAPLAAPLAARGSSRRLALAMAFFILLFCGSVAGFILTRGANNHSSSAAVIGGDILVSVAPATTAPPRPVPKPVTYRGSGDDVVRIRKPESGPALVYLKGNAARAVFSVYALDSQNNKIALVVNSIFAPYEGVRPIDFGPHFETAGLEIHAQGAWTVQVRSVRSAPAFTSSINGTRDSVLRYRGPLGTATLKGGAEASPFSVTTHSGGFPHPIVSTVGTYSGRKAWPSGEVLVEVVSRGRWSISVR